MNPLKEFIIQFAGLKNGCHEFDFKVGDKFFGEFDYSIIKKGNLDVRLSLDKREHLLTLDFAISGTVELVCDRCLDPFDYPLESRQQQLVKISDEVEGGEQEDVVYIGTKEHEIDVTPFIYEFTHLALPMVSIHPDDAGGTPACNPETLAALEKLRTREDKQTPEGDPRWEALKKLRNN
ncbi:uncharacterized metal-binding protein YceD (DUF177 family) [Anseongella ginsenosidimutans]|uniref:Uncharacterized metal-binding protein YceD (DUF177 family) n=1 Tax=Anseongella ginsenosidimutans TaxID=496056 RepID=A0A4V2UTM3_9SPHI|nr:DUF177 domain-containing protein [Anseongella ginsenosidimutans]TCS86722.1 uncharacterized metal-binding protein YceD (DUF177 family) [Anseongella ginsenosidimutans]